MLEGYKERHHIIPKCMGGSNNPENLVELTAKEHFIIHLLLTKIYPSHRGILYSFWALSSMQNTSQERHHISAKTYQHAKECLKAARSLNPEAGMTGKTHSEETKVKWNRKMENNPMFGKTLTDDHKQKISKANLGKKRTDEVKRKLSLARAGKSSWNAGIKHTDEHKKSISDAIKEKHKNGDYASVNRNVPRITLVCSFDGCDCTLSRRQREIDNSKTGKFYCSRRCASQAGLQQIRILNNNKDNVECFVSQS